MSRNSFIEAERKFHKGNRVCFDPDQIAAVEENDDQTVVILKAGEHLQIEASYDEVLNQCNIYFKRCAAPPL